MIKLAITFLLSLLVVTSLQAKLLISPTRVAFDSNERLKEVVLINTSTETLTYRIDWKDLYSLPEGGYVDFDAELHGNFYSASSMVRVSPRQVTLASGERQVIKLLARRSSKFNEAEYRSHLNFIVIPSEILNNDDAPANGIGMKLNLFINYSIPVVLRNQSSDVDIQIKNTQLIFNKDLERYEMKVDFNRSGNTSFVGNIAVYATDKNSGKRSIVGRLNAINMFSEHNMYTRNIALIDYKANPDDNLLIEIKGANEFVGHDITSKQHN